MEVKGAAIAFMTDYLKKEHGEANYQKWLQALNPQAQHIFSSPILPIKWYPMEDAITEPVHRACELFWHGNAKGAWAIGRASAEYGLSNIYKAYTIDESPGELAKKGVVMLQNYYRPSKLELIELSPGRAHFKISEFTGWNQMIEGRICGFMQKGVEMTSGTNVHVAVPVSVLKGNDHTEIVVTWHEPQ
jgi:hypothetical protein